MGGVKLKILTPATRVGRFRFPAIHQVYRNGELIGYVRRLPHQGHGAALWRAEDVQAFTVAKDTKTRRKAIEALISARGGKG